MSRSLPRWSRGHAEIVQDPAPDTDTDVYLTLSIFYIYILSTQRPPDPPDISGLILIPTETFKRKKISISCLISKDVEWDIYFPILTVSKECVIRCQALHVISNLIQHQLSDKWRKRESKVIGLLWLIRQYTDFVRDVLRFSATSGGGGVVGMRGAGCCPVTLWVVRSAHIINCGRLEKIFRSYKLFV